MDLRKRDLDTLQAKINTMKETVKELELELGKKRVEYLKKDRKELLTKVFISDFSWLSLHFSNSETMILLPTAVNTVIWTNHPIHYRIPVPKTMRDGTGGRPRKV